MMTPVERTASDSTLAQDEHDERIATLRTKRRARMRYLAIRGGLGVAAIALLAAAFLYWLLTTIGGRDLLLAQIVARLPANATLTWSRAEGPASGPLTMHDVRFTFDAIEFTAQRVTLDPALRPLLGRRLRLDALLIERATLELPESDEPFELPRWPDSLPQIAPPLALRADDVRIDGLRVTRARAPLIDISRVRGGIDAQPGRLHLESLRIDSDRGLFAVHGDYAPRDDYRTDLVATAVLPAPRGRTRPRLGLVARGDLAKMDVAIAGRAPGPLRATLVLRTEAIATTTMTGTGEVVSAPVATPLERPQWRLNVDAEALDLGAITTPDAAPSDTPLALQLQARGNGGDMRLRGQFRQGDVEAKILTSNLRIQEQVLRLAPLHIEVFDGTLIVRGDADFNEPANAKFRFAANARDLRWGGAAPTTGSSGASATTTPAIEADADFGMAGSSRAWALIGKATLARDGQQAVLDLDGRGNADQLRLRALRVAMPTGTLDATGTVTWAPALGWDLDAALAGFDPGYFAPGWDGAVDGRLQSIGRTRSDGGLEATLLVPDIGGRLRGRPLAGRAQLALHGAPASGGTTRYTGDIGLTLGDSRIDAKGEIGDTLAIDASLAPLQLADLLPNAEGRLRGTLQLRGPRTAPDIEADLDGTGLRWGEYRAEAMSVRGRLPWSRGSGALAVRGSGLQLGVPVDSLTLDARGAVEALQFDADARGAIGTLVVSGNAARRGNAWQGALASLQLTPQRGASWQLREPAQFRWATSASGAGNGSLSNACLASSGGGSLCADADWPRRGLTVKGQGLPLTLLTPYLPAREDQRPWLLRGELAVDAQVRPVGTGWRGQATVTSDNGGLKFRERARSELVHYDDLRLSATFHPQGIEATLGAVLFDDGRIDARIATGWDAFAPLDGEVAIDTDELTWMELFSPDIVEPQGRLAGRIALGGTRAQPRLGGQARLTGFTTEMPALAITLTDGNLQLDAQPDGSARIRGTVRSGEGVLNVDGTLGWQGNDTPLVLNLRGDRVLVSDTRDLRAVVSPDVVVRAAAGQPIAISGTVTVDSAALDLERLDRGVATSPDVVVLDPVDPTDDGIATPVQLDLRLVVGDDVQLSGFGLDGSLAGQLRVRSRAGREMTASGTLDVDGEYTAYGQELDITRGRMSWSNDPVSDPVLNIRAERKVGEITAGVDVSGRATSPEARVWSNPASSQSEALAYLALGRPLSTTSGDERGQLNAASAALSAGGSLLASQLGARIGLDDAGVMQSRALGGSVFGIGKYLSPRLYVGYGVSLLGTGQVLTLKYLLGRGFDIEVESSTVENRGSLNWRKEQ